MRARLTLSGMVITALLLAGCAQEPRTGNAEWFGTATPTAAETDEGAEAGAYRDTDTNSASADGQDAASADEYRESDFASASAETMAAEGESGIVGESPYGLVVVDAGLLYIERGDGARSEIGAEARPKRRAGLSTDGSKVLYEYADVMSPGTAPQLGVYHLGEGSETVIEVDHELALQMNSFYWGSTNTVLVEGHVNPSVTGYVLYDDRSGEEISSAGGLLHQVLADERSLLVQLTPHWQEEGAAAVLDLTVRTADEEGADLYRRELGEHLSVVEVAVSDSMTALAIWLRDADAGTSELWTAALDPNGWTIGESTAHFIDPAVTGSIQFDEKEGLIRIGDEEQFPIPGAE